MGAAPGTVEGVRVVNVDPAPLLTKLLPAPAGGEYEDE